MDLLKRAAGHWEAIYQLHAPELLAVSEAKDHVPCPIHGGVDGFRMFPDWRETGGGVCNTCGNFCNGAALLMWYLDEDYKTVANRVEDVIGKDPDWKLDPEIEKNKLRLQKIQSACKPAGEAVAAYLGGRGLEVPATLQEARLPHWQGAVKGADYHAMVAKFVSASGKPVTFHLTYLQGPRKAQVESPRKVMTPLQSMAGGAVRLYPCTDKLGIAEGIETAIAAKMLFNLPVWAALNAGGLEKFKPPKEVKTLYIFGDNDNSHAGQASAEILARRLWNRIELREVRVPSYVGDWNDVLINEQKKSQ